MAKFFTYPLLAAALSFATPSFAQDTQNVKLFSFTVDRSAVESKLVFSISATDGQSVQVDWGNGTLSNPVTLANYDDDGWVFTSVEGEIAGTNVTVYGSDPKSINYLSINWDTSDDPDAKLKSIDVSLLSGVKDLDVSKNVIGSLDLSACTALTSLTANDNQLKTLTLPESDVLKTVNVSNSINITTGEPNAGAGNNQVLGSKWGNAPKLSSLNLAGNLESEMGFLKSFDISKNVELATLNINFCGISKIDLSPFTKLKTFNAAFNNLHDVDLSKMVVKDGTVFLQNNVLQTITMPDLSGADKMNRLNVANNYLTFATLPVPGSTSNANNYIFAPQGDVKTPMAFNNTVDFTSLAKVGDTASVFVWKKGDAELPQTAYTAADGVFTFKENVEDVYCVITNDAFNGLTLTTTPASSPALLPKMLSMELIAEPGALEAVAPISLSFGSTAEDVQDVYIDWGNGTPVLTTLEKDTWGDPIAIEQPVLGDKIVVYGDPVSINSLSCTGSYDWATGNPNGMLVSKIDLSALTGLVELNLKNNRLQDVDLTANKNLKKVVLTSNKIAKFDADLPELTYLDLANYGSNADKKYGDNALTAIDFAKLPKLETLYVSYTGYKLDFTAVPNLKNVYAIANGMESVDLSKSVALTYLTLNYNALETLDASAITGKANIFATNNNLKSVKVVKNLGNVNLSNNNLTFATLPAVDAVSGTLYFSPQKPMAVSSVNGVVDLSSQAKVGDKETVYTWKLNDAAVTEGIKAENGVFTFSKSGEYTCEMTNEAYPELTLVTDVIKIDAPQGPAKLFSFTVAPAAAGKTMTLNISSTDNQSVQVDWGNGTLSDPVATKNYDVDWEYGTPTGKIAGTAITVYGKNAATINKLDLGWDKEAGEETKILSIDLSPLSGMDDLAISSNAISSLDLTGNTSLAKLFINGNNITDIKFPENCAILRIEAQNTADAGENDLFKVDLSKAAKLNYININFNNKDAEATTIDLGKNAELATVMATDCNLETIDVSKLAKLGQLTVNNNNLATVDVSVMGERGRLFAMNNKLTSLTLPKKLAVLNVSNNKLTFASLPAATIAGTYTYDKQKPMVVEAVAGKVDLTSQAKVGDVETVFAWTANSEEFTDFAVANGMITFTKSAENAVCSMTNAMLPKLTLTTVPVNVTVDESAVTEIEDENANEPVEYYNLQGVKVSGNEPGIYIRRQGNKTEKVIVK